MKIVLAVLVAALLWPRLGWSGPSVYPTGVTVYDPARAYSSFVCFSALDGIAHLIDMDGNEVHSWPYPGAPAALIDPGLIGGARGHVLLQTATGSDPRGGIFTNRSVAELDWNGAKLWEWSGEAPDFMARQNHDWARLANGDTLLLVTVPRAVRALDTKEIGDQAIYEVDPAGKVVWKWLAGDHLDGFGFTRAGIAYLKGRIARNPPEAWGYLEINDMTPLGPNRWSDDGDRRFDPDNIMIDTRKGNVVLIIDRKTGSVVWRLGPEFPDSDFVQDHRILEETVPRPVDQLSGQHDAHLIGKGLPGAGNLLLFDDQGGAGFPPAPLGIYAGSRILEIDPVKKQIVWQYTGANSDRPVWSFFSSFVSSAQRLPNGNTLIDEGMNGRLFQITPGGEIVWEYVNPYQTAGVRNGHRILNPLVYRAQAVPYDWAPDGTPHSELAVSPPALSEFKVPIVPPTR
jgi:hypothetical protein